MHNIYYLGLSGEHRCPLGYLFYFCSKPLWRNEDTTEMVLDEKRDGLVDEYRVNKKENKNNRVVFMLYIITFLPIIYNLCQNDKK